MHKSKCEQPLFEDRKFDYMQSVKHGVAVYEVCLMPNFVLMFYLLPNISLIFYFEV
jgi:hypothetical protein